MTQISDYTKYVQLMRNGFYDKLFFVDKLFGEWKTMVDYGCADGFLTKLIGQIFPDKKVIGYDGNEKLIREAMDKRDITTNVSFVSDVNELNSNNDIILLSSVLHEIYSYCTEKEINEFWNLVLKFKTIVIRDMLYDERTLVELGLSYNFNYNRASYVYQVYSWCEKNQKMGELIHFESIWGNITEPKSFVHFLLKYPYIDSPNWNREVGENYLSFSIQDLMPIVDEGNYRYHFCETSSIPYLANKWYNDFGITEDLNTHSKIILVSK